MPFTDTSDSQTTNRIAYHASYRYQQITDNKSYILSCLTQMPANHNNKSATIKSQATNRTSCHASHRCQQITGNKSFILPCLHTYQQITGNKSCILPCLTQIPANERQQVVQLTMLHTDTSKTQSTKRASCRPPQISVKQRKQSVNLTMPHTGTSKSQATNPTSCRASHTDQQITNNKSY